MGNRGASSGSPSRKLLHLLEERTFERVGGAETLVIDVRMIAATNRDLEQMVEDGSFRGDLYYRLQAFPVRLPPLRERREDVLLLALYFMERMAAHLSKKVTGIEPEALSVLQSYSWPGNVRELEHAVQRTVELYGYETLRFAFHPGDAEPGSGARLTVTANPGKRVDLLADVRVDLERREWQVVEVPLEMFECGPSLVSVNLAGSFGGTFYLDDVSLVSREAPERSTAVEEETAARPEDFTLAQNYPNPFNSRTVIRFSLNASDDVELAVFNLAGQRVAMLVDGVRNAGTHTIGWNGRDDSGRALASGIYLYRLRAGRQAESRKMILAE